MRRFFNIYDNSNRSNNLITTQNCREDIIGELEAIIQYENHLFSTDDPVARAIIQDIVDEEKLHVGQLFGLLLKDNLKKVIASLQPIMKNKKIR